MRTRFAPFDTLNLDICENLYAQANAVTAPYYSYTRSQELVAGETSAVLITQQLFRQLLINCGTRRSIRQLPQQHVNSARHFLHLLVVNFIG